MNDTKVPDRPDAIPDTFGVSVILQVPHGRDAASPGEAIGVVVTDAGQSGPMRCDAQGEQVLRPGFRLTLYKDEAESYYMNLTGDQPSVFVICRADEDAGSEPALVTLSYDEVSSYMEVEDAVFAVPMPPELYRWVEVFVLEYYVPERRKKPKLDKWKEGGLR